MSWLQRITIAACLIWIAYMISTIQNLLNFLSQK